MGLLLNHTSVRWGTDVWDRPRITRPQLGILGYTLQRDSHYDDVTLIT